MSTIQTSTTLQTSAKVISTTRMERRRPKLAEQVAERIRRDIISGRLSQGAMVAEIPTARRLNVSRVPVREALLVLEQDGLLVSESNGRCRVRTLTNTDFHEIYGIRLMLETTSFRLAALQHTSADLKSLQNNIRLMERARSLHKVTLLDLEFHQQIMQISRQSRLLHLWQTMRSQVQLFTAILQREISVVISSVREVSLQAHQACLQGIASRDPDIAGRCALEHLEPWQAWLRSTRPEGGVR